MNYEVWHKCLRPQGKRKISIFLLTDNDYKYINQKQIFITLTIIIKIKINRTIEGHNLIILWIRSKIHSRVWQLQPETFSTADFVPSSRPKTSLKAANLSIRSTCPSLLFAFMSSVSHSQGVSQYLMWQHSPRSHQRIPPDQCAASEQERRKGCRCSFA